MGASDQDGTAAFAGEDIQPIDAGDALAFDEDGIRPFAGDGVRENPSAASARFPNLRPATGQQRPPVMPPPPAPSARFPDAPPPATGSLPRVDTTGASSRPAAKDAEGAIIPPRPATAPRATTGNSQERSASAAPRIPERPFAPPRPSTPAPPVTRPAVSPRRTGMPEEAVTETTARLRPIPAEPPTPPTTPPPTMPLSTTPPPTTTRPSTPLSAGPVSGPAASARGGATPSAGASLRLAEAWDSTSAAHADRPFVSLASPDTHDDDTARLGPLGDRVRPVGPRAAAAAACVVLGLGLIGGAATGSWLTGDSAGAAGARDSFTAAADLWHSVPVDQIFPTTVEGEGAGPGGADRAWTRIAVAPDSGCAKAFDPLLRKVLAPAGCLRLLRATYTDETRSHVITVGLLFTKADSAAMGVLNSRFKDEGLDRRRDLLPRPYAAKGTVAAGFGDDQRASWTLSVLTDAPVVVYAVSGFADGRSVTEPQPAEDAMETGATTPPAQAGLGHDAQGLADRIERGLRKNVGSATEKPS